MSSRPLYAWFNNVMRYTHGTSTRSGPTYVPSGNFPGSQIYHRALVSEFVSCQQFLSAPMCSLNALGQSDSVEILKAGYRPLLPAQVCLRQAREAQWCPNGTWLESPAARQTMQSKTIVRLPTTRPRDSAGATLGMSGVSKSVAVNQGEWPPLWSRLHLRHGFLLESR
jgi:hypothetical protein